MATVNYDQGARKWFKTNENLKCVSTTKKYFCDEQAAAHWILDMQKTGGAISGMQSDHPLAEAYRVRLNETMFPGTTTFWRLNWFCTWHSGVPVATRVFSGGLFLQPTDPVIVASNDVHNFRIVDQFYGTEHPITGRMVDAVAAPPDLRSALSPLLVPPVARLVEAYLTLKVVTFGDLRGACGKEIMRDHREFKRVYEVHGCLFIVFDLTPSQL